jgi:acyl carrier protein
MSPDDIRAVLKDELGRIAPEIEFEAIPPDALLRQEIDIDSMDFLNLVTALHQRLKVDIPEADYPQLATIRGALAYLSTKTA